jgi:hypothetical protein
VVQAGQASQSELAVSRLANSLSLNDMIKVVAMIYQQIMTELNAADRKKEYIIMAITKIV